MHFLLPCHGFITMQEFEGEPLVVIAADNDHRAPLAAAGAVPGPPPTAHLPQPTAHSPPSTASVSTPSTAHLVQLNVPSALALRRDLGGRVPTRAAAAAPRGERNSVRMPRRRRRSSSSTCCAPANAAATSTSRDASSLHAQMVRRTTAARRRQRGGVSVPQDRARPSAVVISSKTSSSISTAIIHASLPAAAWNDQGSRRSQDGTHGSARLHKGKGKVGHDPCAAAISRGRPRWHDAARPSQQPTNPKGVRRRRHGQRR